MRLHGAVIIAPIPSEDPSTFSFAFIRYLDQCIAMGGAASHPLEEQLLSEQEYSQAKHLSTVMLEADPENATLRLIAKAVRLAKVSCTQPGT